MNAATDRTDASADELFSLVATIEGLDAANDDGDDAAPARCAGGCYGGLVADPHGPSRHNPTGLRGCPVCG